MKNSTEFPQTIKNRTTILSSNFTCGYLFKENEKLTQRDIYTTMFIAALFTVAKRWKQPNCPSLNEWIKKL